jgi:hypothetical protein
MRVLRLSAVVLLALAGCYSDSGSGPYGGAIAQPYESCSPRDGCSHGTACLETTLPASAGYTGSLCTVDCGVSADCPQDLSNYEAICVNGQCYTQCPAGGSTCPYGTGCLTFSDQYGDPVDICTP